VSFTGKIETTANVATICVAALLSTVLVKAYLLPPRVARPRVAAAEAEVGTNIKDRLPGVDWSRNGRTLILAVSTQCHFCKESTPFYRKLQQEVGRNIKMVAVLPQPISDAEQYLKGEGVQIDQVKQVPLETIGVSGTPTMLLVNSSGIVTKVWTGKIPPEEQDQVLGILRKG
jgi:thioredoxin-related protein